MRLRVLYVSNLYPSAQRPLAGAFNVPAFDRLRDRCDIRIIAPVMTRLFCQSPIQLATSAEWTADSRVVDTPPANYIPKLGWFNGMLFSRSIARSVTTATRDWRPDVVLSSWLYPDAYGAFIQSARRQWPFVCDALGSDVHQFFEFPLRRRQILRVARGANAVVTRSAAIKHKLVAAGIQADKVTVLYNGVNHDEFRPLEKRACAERLGLDPQRQRILFAGTFNAVKNVATLLQATARLREGEFPNLELVLAGDGRLKQIYRNEIAARGLANTVTMSDGFLPHARLPDWINASDLVCLPSLNEGVPNIVLESMACGVPVVASNVGGIPEVLTEAAGLLIHNPRDSVELATVLQSALTTNWNRPAIQNCSRRFSWDQTADQLYHVLSHAAGTELD